MGVFKLQLEDFNTANFELIAIHTTLEITKLAFLLNKNLNTKFRYFGAIDKKEKKNTGSFTRYEYENIENEIFWNLFENKTLINNTNEKDSLLNQFAQIMYLLPEYKQVDFIIKIEAENQKSDISKTIKNILKIKNISMSYILDTNKIKTKSNLIF